MVELLTQEQIILFKEMFIIYDKDEDDSLDDLNAGELSSKELGTVMHLLCAIPTETDLHPIMNVMDHNNNLKITFAQFSYCRGSHSERRSFREEAQKILDKDKKGFITVMDLHHSMTGLGKNLTQEEVNEMLQKADMNINCDEFVKMMTEK